MMRRRKNYGREEGDQEIRCFEKREIWRSPQTVVPVMPLSKYWYANIYGSSSFSKYDVD